MEWILIFIGAALINNIILSHSLGIRHMIDESKQLKSAFSMGLAVSFVMTVSVAMIFLIHNFMLYPLGITYLNLIIFVLIIVGLAQLLVLFMKKIMASLHEELGINVALVTTNSAILGIILISLEQFGSSFALTLAYTLGSAVGFILVMVLFAGIIERIRHNEISPNFEGIPIAMIAAGLMAIVFFGFTGIVSF
jgi:electron transport complex protein RnfA